MKKIFITILLGFVNLPLLADGFIETINIGSAKINDSLILSKEPIAGAIIDTTLVSASIAAWGFSQWNWGSEPIHFHDEGWFEGDSKTGGSDKTGHFYMTYALSRMMAARMQDRGYSLESSSFWGAISGLTSMTLLEIGDGTSPYGFSKEDFIADTVGAVLAYFIRANPKVDDFIDIRLEYWPTGASEGRDDLTTDYSSMRHLVAFKLLGFDALKSTPLSLIEFQLGYYSRGYRSYDTVEESQNIYIGIGISLADIARRSKIHALENAFEFYQPGHTYLETDVWSR